MPFATGCVWGSVSALSEEGDVNLKDTRLLMAAVVGAVAALLVGYMVEHRSGLSLTEWMFEHYSDYSWVIWMGAGAVLGGFGYMLLNRDDKQP